MRAWSQNVMIQNEEMLLICLLHQCRWRSVQQTYGLVLLFAFQVFVPNIIVEFKGKSTSVKRVLTFLHSKQGTRCHAFLYIMVEL